VQVAKNIAEMNIDEEIVEAYLQNVKKMCICAIIFIRKFS
jgi:hypothetical protein